MGRRKIEIKPITHDRNRTITFSKRKDGLFKKAYELGVLCSVDIAVIVFDKRSGRDVKLFQYCSGDVNELVQRHINYDGQADTRTPDNLTSKTSLKAEDGIEDGEDDEDEEEEAEPVPVKVPQKRRIANDDTAAKTPLTTGPSIPRVPSTDSARPHKRARPESPVRRDPPHGVGMPGPSSNAYGHHMDPPHASYVPYPISPSYPAHPYYPPNGFGPRYTALSERFSLPFPQQHHVPLSGSATGFFAAILNHDTKQSNGQPFDWPVHESAQRQPGNSTSWLDL